ncbi:MAG: glycosyltransferase family 4 protein [Candidatus Acidiferrales bacterium]
MRILLLVDCYYPNSKSSATQMHDLALELCRQEHDVIVLTPSDRVSNGLELTTECGIQVVRVRTRKIKGASRVFRAIEESRLSSVLWSRAKAFLRQHPADLIVFYSPTIFWAPLVRRLKSLWACPAYLILRDIFPAWAVDAGILRKGLIYYFFRRKEKLQYRVADRIAVQSPANLDYFVKEFRTRRYPLEVLYNWMTLYVENLPSTDYRAQLGLQGKVVFVYGGNLGVAQDVDNIVRLAVRLVDHGRIHFLLVGEGSEVPRLERLLAENRLHNVQLLPSVSPTEYLALLSEFDVGLLSLDRRLKSHNVPGKLLGYMYWCKPTLASINPGNDLFELLGKNEAGFCLSNGDDDGLYEAALRLADDPELRNRMGKNSRILLERMFSVKGAVAQILNRFQTQNAFAKEAVAGQPIDSLSEARKLSVDC